MSITTDRTPLEIQQGPQTKPYLEPGINLLDTDKREIHALKSLVINQLILDEDSADFPFLVQYSLQSIEDLFRNWSIDNT